MMTQTALLALMMLATCVPVSAQWQRIVFGEKGNTVDVAEAHPLSYFTANPFLRDDEDEFCLLCTPAGKAESARRYTIRSVVKPVGVFVGFRVIDVFYYPSAPDSIAATDAKWKSILVQVGPDRYREIFVTITPTPLAARVWLRP